MNADLISRSALRKEIDCCDIETYADKETILEQIALAPTVEAEPVVHARWDIRDNPGYFDTYGRPDQSAHCTHCSFRWNDLYSVKNYFKCCPNCGAKMDLEA